MLNGMLGGWSSIPAVLWTELQSSQETVAESLRDQIPTLQRLRNGDPSGNGGSWLGSSQDVGRFRFCRVLGRLSGSVNHVDSAVPGGRRIVQASHFEWP
jgi:hypothetical protein